MQYSSNYGMSLLTIDMKTKVFQHVPRVIFSVFKVFKLSGFQFLVPCQGTIETTMMEDQQDQDQEELLEKVVGNSFVQKLLTTT